MFLAKQICGNITIKDGFSVAPFLLLWPYDWKIKDWIHYSIYYIYEFSVTIRNYFLVVGNKIWTEAVEF